MVVFGPRVDSIRDARTSETASWSCFIQDEEQVIYKQSLSIIDTIVLWSGKVE